MNCGLKATIIEYRNASDIDVQFENKAIRQHMTKNNFMHGEIAPKKDRSKTEHINETRTKTKLNMNQSPQLNTHC